MTLPAISVIIPLYNAEKYIGDCLESLLTQTFQDFEVIVVDDCSTDNSLAVVESYAQKFNGRLKLAAPEKNSGGGGYIPRNIGLNLSCGEYVFFVDADDFLMEFALEKLFAAAQNFNVDVVYISAYYSYGEPEEVKLALDAQGKDFFRKKIEDKPTLTINAPNENFQKLFFGGEWFHMPWSKFVRRNFLIDNGIVFPKILSGGDFIWTIQVLYYAKRLLRLPLPIYFYRKNAVGSVTNKRKKSPHEQISDCVKAFLLGAEALRELSTRIDLLRRQDYFSAALTPFFNNCLKRSFDERMQMETQEICEILAREFDGDSSKFILPFLFGALDAQQKSFVALKTQVDELEKSARQDKAYIAELEKFIAHSAVKAEE